MSNKSKDALRSWLIAPANVERRARKALDCGADVAVLDLEDAVALSEKPAARRAAVERLQETRSCLGYVRVNAYEEGCFEDLLAVVGPWLDGILVPKVEDAEASRAIDWALRHLEARHGMTQGTVDMVPIIESCTGLARVHEVASACRRTCRLAFGAGDFTRDLGVTWSRDEHEIEPARFQIAVASRHAGLAAPIDTVFIDLADDDGLNASVARGARWGFGAKACIHPQQLAAIHAGLGPSATSIAEARAIVAAFGAAEAAGDAAIRVQGKLVDYAIAKRAQDILDLADQHARRETPAAAPS